MNIGQLVMDVVVNTGNLAGQLSSVRTAIVGALSGVITGVLSSQIRELAMEATKAEIAVKVFNNTLKAQGQNSVEAARIVNSLAKEFKVMPEDVMNSATALIRMGATMEQVQTLFRGAGASALAYGRDAKTGFENVSSAVVTGTSALLNQIGIAENLGPTLDKYARSLGKTSDELTAQERILASTNMIMKATEQEYKSLGDMMGGLVGENADLTKATTELRRALGAELTPVVRQVTDALTGLIRGLKDSASAVGGFKNLLGQIVDRAGEAAFAIMGVAIAIWATNTAIQNVIRTQFLAFWTRLVAFIGTTAIPTIGTLGGVIQGLLGPIGLVTLALTGLMTYALKIANDIKAIYDGVAAGIEKSNNALMGRVKALAQGTEFERLQAKIILLKGQLAELNPEDTAGKASLKKRIDDLEALAAATKKSADEAARHNQVTSQGSTATRDYLAEARKLYDAFLKAKPGTQAWVDAQKALDAFTNKNKDAQYALASIKEAQQQADQATKNNAKTLKGEARDALTAQRNYLERVRNELTVLSSNYSLGSITVEEYRKGLQDLINTYTPAIARTKEGSETWQAFTGVVLGAKSALKDLNDEAEKTFREKRKGLLTELIGQMDMERVQGELYNVEIAIAKTKDKIQKQRLLDKQELLLARQGELEEAAHAVGQAVAASFQKGYKDEVNLVDPLNPTLEQLKKNLGEISDDRIPMVIDAVQSLLDQGAIVDTDGSITLWLKTLGDRAATAKKAADDLAQSLENLDKIQANQAFQDWKAGLSGMDGLTLSGMLSDRQDQLLTTTDLGVQASLQQEIEALQAALDAYNAKASKMLGDYFKTQDEKFLADLKGASEGFKKKFAEIIKKKKEAQEQALALAAIGPDTPTSTPPGDTQGLDTLLPPLNDITAQIEQYKNIFKGDPLGLEGALLSLLETSDETTVGFDALMTTLTEVQQEIYNLQMAAIQAGGDLQTPFKAFGESDYLDARGRVLSLTETVQFLKTSLKDDPQGLANALLELSGRASETDEGFGDLQSTLNDTLKQISDPSFTEKAGQQFLDNLLGGGDWKDIKFVDDLEATLDRLVSAGFGNTKLAGAIADSVQKWRTELASLPQEGQPLTETILGDVADFEAKSDSLLETINLLKSSYNDGTNKEGLLRDLKDLEQFAVSSGLEGSDALKALRSLIADTEAGIMQDGIKFSEQEADRKIELMQLVADQEARLRAKEQQAQREAYDRAERMEENRLQYELATGAMSTQEYLAYLQDKLIGYEQFSDEWMEVTRKIDAAAQSVTWSIGGFDTGLKLFDTIKMAIHDLASTIKDTLGESIRVGLNPLIGKAQELTSALMAAEPNTAAWEAAKKAYDDFSKSSMDAKAALDAVAQGATDFGSSLLSGVVGVTQKVVDAIVEQIIAFQAQAMAMAIAKGAAFDWVGAIAMVAGAVAIGGIVDGLLGRIQDSSASSRRLNVDGALNPGKDLKPSEQDMKLFGQAPEIGYSPVLLTLSQVASRFDQAVTRFDQAVEKGLKVDVRARSMDWGGLL